MFHTMKHEKKEIEEKEEKEERKPPTATEEAKEKKVEAALIKLEPPAERKKLLLDKSVLSIWLDSYNDIFSDFDSRPYTERALSDDFISEAKKIEKEKITGSITLKLLLPAHLRKKATETIILRSIHTRFRNLSFQLMREINRTRRRGGVLSVIGLAAMIAANYLINLHEKTYLVNALLIVMEPAGWYFVWTGLDQFFYGSREKKQELDFNIRMAHSKIIFLSI